MATDWRPSTWGEEITLEYGKAHRGHGTSVGRYRVFGSNGPIGWTNEPLAPGPGVILGRKGAYRGVEFSRDPFFVIDTAYYVATKSELDMRWIYYAIRHHKLGEIDDGSPIPSTTRAAVYIRELQVPPKSEQEAIAHVLGTLDDKIELNRRMNDTLEGIAGAIFKSWFVDFDPVRAKAEGRDPGVPKPIADLFPDNFEDSPLGPIPKGWEIVPVGGVMDNYDAKRIPLSGRERASRKGPYPYYGAASVMDHVADYLFDGIYLLVGEDGSVIKDDNSAVTQYAWGQFWVNNHAHVLQGKSDVCTEHLLLYFRSANMQPYITGAVQPKLNQGNLNRMPFLRATPEVLTAFAEVIQPLFGCLRASVDQNRTLAAIRDTLLPKLLSGEVRLNGTLRGGHA